jgi:hypothetical protein
MQPSPHSPTLSSLILCSRPHLSPLHVISPVHFTQVKFCTHFPLRPSTTCPAYSILPDLINMTIRVSVRTSTNYEDSHYISRSQRPRGLRRRSAAVHLLGLRFRIPPGPWTFVSCECSCCQVEVSATGRSLVQRSPTDCGAFLTVIK